jgi:hypothetical protein
MARYPKLAEIQKSLEYRKRQGTITSSEEQLLAELEKLGTMSVDLQESFDEVRKVYGVMGPASGRCNCCGRSN